MKIKVTAKPKKKKRYVEQNNPNHYTVSVCEPAQNGKANQAIIAALAEYFGIPKNQITLVTGKTSKLKVFDVPDNLSGFVPRLKQLRLIEKTD